MKTPMEIRAANMAVRDACARQALRRAEGVSAGDVRAVREVELERWEAVRAQMAPLRLPWGMESAEVLAAVAAHRAYWRPAEVRLLILSESHVWTREAELAAEGAARSVRSCGGAGGVRAARVLPRLRGAGPGAGARASQLGQPAVLEAARRGCSIPRLARGSWSGRNRIC